MSEDQAAIAPNPPIIVIFGITGDLAQRYLLPALYHLMKDGLLDSRAEIVGISRQAITAEQLLDQIELCVNEVDQICDPDTLKAIHRQTRMIQMDLDDAAAYGQLRQTLDAIEAEKGTCLNRLYYLAIPPQTYRPVIRHMGEQGLNTSCQHGRAVTRLLVEKPFGYDLASAEQLINETAAVFGEDQLFRVDHFLAKPAVQNLLGFRFQAPAAFEARWNNEHVASVEISASEQIGIEGRARFYDQLGALRDFIQNHLLQVLALVTMDQPAALDSAHIHAAKQAVLRQVNPVQPQSPDQIAHHAVGNQPIVNSTVRGQYAGYRAEAGNPDSTTETYADLTATIDTDRWRGVAFRLWTGKAMAEKKYEIIINFKMSETKEQRRLRFRIQPDPAITLESLNLEADTWTIQQNFPLEPALAAAHHPDAYERVLADAIRGDRTRFATADEILASWRVIQPLVTAWPQASDDLQIYEPGTPGPLKPPLN